MRLFSYVVARDYGFAPNPFFDVCTLATCKPKIRGSANVGDWVVGTGSKTLGLEGRLVFAMRVGETLTFDAYWKDKRFRDKRPNLRGSIKTAYGDNIYRRSGGKWVQENSHHSLPNGKPNPANIKHDTQINRVLISNWFVYFGGEARKIPARFRKNGLEDICCQRGHKSNFPSEFAERFVAWVVSLGVSGFAGEPHDFMRRGKSSGS